MRRTLFNLTTALLAFSIGSFIALKFYWKTDEKPIYNEEAKITAEAETEQYIGRGFATGDGIRRSSESVYEPKLHKTTCSDKKLLPVWNELKKDKVFREREKEGFYQAGDCAELFEVDRMDLNDDGQKEFIVWGRYDFSGATGNTVVWVYEKRNGGYKQLLQFYAYKNGDEEWFEIKRDKTKGYRNLLLKGHFTASETTNTFFKFNGIKYVENKCWFEIYLMNEETPTIMSCKEYSEQSN